MMVLSEDPFSVMPPPSAVVSDGLAVDPSSMFLSSIVTVVELTDVTVPFTVKSPPTIKSLPMVTLLGKPTVSVLLLLLTSTSLAVPWTVRVAPSATALEVDPSLTLKLVVTVPPKAIALPLIVMLLLARLLFGTLASEPTPVELL